MPPSDHLSLPFFFPLRKCGDVTRLRNGFNAEQRHANALDVIAVNRKLNAPI